MYKIQNETSQLIKISKFEIHNVHGRQTVRPRPASSRATSIIHAFIKGRSENFPFHSCRFVGRKRVNYDALYVPSGVNRTVFGFVCLVVLTPCLVIWLFVMWMFDVEECWGIGGFWKLVRLIIWRIGVCVLFGDLDVCGCRMYVWKILCVYVLENGSSNKSFIDIMLFDYNNTDLRLSIW